MKYFAILKDSLREAVDSKVMYVLLGLSTVVILFAGTFSFTPLSAQRTMEQFFPDNAKATLPLAIALNNHKPEKAEELMGMRRGPWMHVRLVKVELLRGEPDSPDSDYLVTLASPGKQDGNFPGGGDKLEPLKAVREYFRDAEELGYVQIDDVKAVENPKGQGDSLYQVTVKGTPRTFRIWAAQPSLFFGAVPIGEFAAPLSFQVYYLTSLVLYLGSWFAVLVAVVITSFFIPNMLRKGTVDLLLVKPIHRWMLLTYKFVGGLTFIFLCASYALGGIWLVLGLRTGLWANWSLLLILTNTFFFAILYSVSTFVGVITRSTVTAIMVTIGAWILFFIVGFAQNIFHNQYLIEQDREKKNVPIPEEGRWGSGTTALVVRSIHTITPRTRDLDHLNDMIVYCDFMTGSLMDMEKFDTSKRNWWESVAVSAAWILIFLGLAALWFTFKDY